MQASRGPVSLNVGGQQYRVVASVPEETLRRLAGVVDERIRAIVPPGKPVSPNAILLAAIALAHEVEEERGKREQLESRSRDVLRRLLSRIDDALDHDDDPASGSDDPSPVAPPASF